jgi:catechol 2,3-dioxygenase-like lactoylglutathione lyase family enzyme
LGFSYLTIVVNDTNAALARLKKAGVKPIAKTPVELPKNLAPGVFLTVVRDPDGNLVELVGPKK